MKLLASVSSAAVVVSLLAQPLQAQETSRVQQQTTVQAQATSQAQPQDPIYGSSLMTQQERNEYQKQIRQLKSEEDRTNFRARHQEQMQQRAKILGQTLADDVPVQRGG